MAVWIPILRAALIAPVLLAYGSALDEQRLEDHTVPLPIDRAMDARITAYVPLVREMTRSAHRPEDLFRIASRWREGRRSGELRDPMPARYGDDEDGSGARKELVTFARQFANWSMYRAEETTDRALSERLFAAALEPLRTVQYADVTTLGETCAFRAQVEGRMARAGFAAEEIRRTTAILRIDPRKRAELYRHMARLRSEFRVRYDDLATLHDADPAFERLVRSETLRARYVASR